MSSTRFDLVDLTVKFWRKSALAIKVSDTDDEETAVWLPFSQIEMATADPERGEVIEVACPEWLATEKGLV